MICKMIINQLQVIWREIRLAQFDVTAVNFVDPMSLAAVPAPLVAESRKGIPFA
jgi:hypothetical protein